MIPQRQKPPTLWLMIVLFIVITMGTLVVGFVYFNYQKKTLLSETQIELSAISDLKIRQITQWRLERIGDGQFLGDNILIVRKLSEFIKKPEDKLLRADII